MSGDAVAQQVKQLLQMAASHVRESVGVLVPPTSVPNFCPCSCETTGDDSSAWALAPWGRLRWSPGFLVPPKLAWLLLAFEEQTIEWKKSVSLHVSLPQVLGACTHIGDAEVASWFMALDQLHSLLLQFGE